MRDAAAVGLTREQKLVVRRGRRGLKGAERGKTVVEGGRRASRKYYIYDAIMAGANCQPAHRMFSVASQHHHQPFSRQGNVLVP